jgi:hypothetical protein
MIGNVAKARLKEKFSKLIGDELQAMDENNQTLSSHLKNVLAKPGLPF